MAPPPAAAATAAVRHHRPRLLRRCGGRLPSHIRVRSLFTGIVEEVGRVCRLGPPLAPSGGGGGGGGDAPGLDLEVESKNLLTGTQLGDSVAVDGTCLTV